MNSLIEPSYSSEAIIKFFFNYKRLNFDFLLIFQATYFAFSFIYPTLKVGAFLYIIHSKIDISNYFINSQLELTHSPTFTFSLSDQQIFLYFGPIAFSISPFSSANPPFHFTFFISYLQNFRFSLIIKCFSLCPSP